MTFTKKWVILTVAFILIIVTSMVVILNTVGAKKVHRENATIVFLHGYGSSARASNKLADATQSRLSIRNRKVIRINRDGKFKIDHQQISRAGNIFQLEFTDKQTSEKDETKYLAHFMKTLKMQGIKTISLSGHSMGANVGLRYNMDKTYQTTAYPKVDKLVTIAAPFNMGINYPNMKKEFQHNRINKKTQLPLYQDDNFKYFYKNRHNLNPQLAIMNIFGDIGDQSDGVVTNFSSQALRFFVSKKQRYVEMSVTGEHVQHSQIRDNQTVTRQVAEFLNQ